MPEIRSPEFMEFLRGIPPHTGDDLEDQYQDTNNSRNHNSFSQLLEMIDDIVVELIEKYGKPPREDREEVFWYLIEAGIDNCAHSDGRESHETEAERLSRHFEEVLREHSENCWPGSHGSGHTCQQGGQSHGHPPSHSHGNERSRQHGGQSHGHPPSRSHGNGRSRHHGDRDRGEVPGARRTRTAPRGHSPSASDEYPGPRNRDPPPSYEEEDPSYSTRHSAQPRRKAPPRAPAPPPHGARRADGPRRDRQPKSKPHHIHYDDPDVEYDYTIKPHGSGQNHRGHGGGGAPRRSHQDEYGDDDCEDDDYEDDDDEDDDW